MTMTVTDDAEIHDTETVRSLHITRTCTRRIVTSGYTDRYLSGDMAVSIRVTSRSRPDFEAQFRDENNAVAFLQAHSGMDWETAYGRVSGSPLTNCIAWSHRGTSSLAAGADLDAVANFLAVITTSRTPQSRLDIAQKLQLSRHAFYAICWGLYQCNQANALMERRGLRAEGTAQVHVPGFELDTPYVAEAVNAAVLSAAALDGFSR